MHYTAVGMNKTLQWCHCQWWRQSSKFTTCGVEKYKRKRRKEERWKRENGVDSINTLEHRHIVAETICQLTDLEEAAIWSGVEREATTAAAANAGGGSAHTDKLRNS